MRVIVLILSLFIISYTSVSGQKPAAPNTPEAKKAAPPNVTTVGDAVVRNAAGTMIRGSSVPKQPFKIYTNPAREQLLIEYASADFKDGDIKVSDVKGKLIKQVLLEGNLTKLNLNTSTWKNGAYTIVLTQYNTHQTVMQTIYLSR
jgi:Secretion system C-terminal sorting domain